MGRISCCMSIPPIGTTPSSDCCMEDTILSVSQKVNPRGISDTDITWEMDNRKEIAARLRRMRIKRGYENAAEAAVVVGANPVTYRAHENGGKPISPEVAVKYCKRLKGNPAWLIFGDEYVTVLGEVVVNATNDPLADIAWKRIPVLNTKMLSKEKPLQRTLDQSTEFVAVPGLEDAGALTFAHRIVDESMFNPPTGDFFRPGDIVIFDGDRKAIPGDYVLVNLRDGDEDACIFRQLRMGNMGDDGVEIIDLLPVNPGYKMETIISGETGDIVGRLICHHRRY
jgi:hypothetical protein